MEFKLKLDPKQIQVLEAMAGDTVEFDSGQTFTVYKTGVCSDLESARELFLVPEGITMATAKPSRLPDFTEAGLDTPSNFLQWSRKVSKPPIKKTVSQVEEEGGRTVSERISRSEEDRRIFQGGRER